MDISNFGTSFARLAPRLALTLSETAAEISFGALDDFHPDRLFARIASFEALRQLRAALTAPAKFRLAAAALGATPATVASISLLMRRTRTTSSACSGASEPLHLLLQG